MSDEYSDQQLVDQYFKLDKTLEDLNAEHKKKCEPYGKAIAAIKAMLHDRLNKRGAKHTAVTGGTAFKVETMTTKVTDKAAYIRFCISDPDWGTRLLTAHVSKDELKKFMEEHTIQTEQGPVERVPPGVEVDYFEQLQIRRVG